MTPIDPLTIAAIVAEALERLGIPYVIGGSVAASVIAEPRTTLDLDVMIDADTGKVQELVKQLAPDFYVDEGDAIDAVRHLRSFNAIHFHSAMKVDFFIAEPLGREQIARREALEARPGGPPLYFYSAEDLVVRKLLWYRAGGESSSRQWRDVVSILKTVALNLDRAALVRRAREQRVDDLLVRAANDAGLDL